MADLTIYLGNKNYSSWSLRPWLVLKRTTVAFDEVVIPLYQSGSRETVLKYSPSGRVPALRHGELTVWESLAICEYLAETFPNFELWPKDQAARARARFGQGGDFLFGQFTIVDAIYAPVVTRFRTYKIDLEREADAYCEAIMALPAMQEWITAARNEPMIIEQYEF